MTPRFLFIISLALACYWMVPASFANDFERRMEAFLNDLFPTASMGACGVKLEQKKMSDFSDLVRTYSIGPTGIVIPDSESEIDSGSWILFEDSKSGSSLMGKVLSTLTVIRPEEEEFPSVVSSLKVMDLVSLEDSEIVRFPESGFDRVWVVSDYGALVSHYITRGFEGNWREVSFVVLSAFQKGRVRYLPHILTLLSLLNEEPFIVYVEYGHPHLPETRVRIMGTLKEIDSDQIVIEVNGTGAAITLQMGKHRFDRFLIQEQGVDLSQALVSLLRDHSDRINFH